MFGEIDKGPPSVIVQRHRASTIKKKYIKKSSLWTVPKEYSWGEVTRAAEVEREAFWCRLRCRRQNLYTLSPFLHTPASLSMTVPAVTYPIGSDPLFKCINNLYCVCILQVQLDVIRQNFGEFIYLFILSCSTKRWSEFQPNQSGVVCCWSIYVLQFTSLDRIEWTFFCLLLRRGEAFLHQRTAQYLHCVEKRPGNAAFCQISGHQQRILWPKLTVTFQ